MKYLSIDTETGGLGPETSLLSLAVVLADQNLNEISSEHWLLKPDDGIYHVEAGGMAVNKIDLVQHDMVAETYKDAKNILYDYIKYHSCAGKEKLCVVGKQVHGDTLRIWQNLLSKNTWEQFCSYQQLDVSSVFRLMQHLGYFKPEDGGSLKFLMQYYRIDGGNQHEALFDARATLQVLRNMTVTLKSGRRTFVLNPNVPNFKI